VTQKFIQIHRNPPPSRTHTALQQVRERVVRQLETWQAQGRVLHVTSLTEEGQVLEVSLVVPLELYRDPDSRYQYHLDLQALEQDDVLVITHVHRPHDHTV